MVNVSCLQMNLEVYKMPQDVYYDDICKNCKGFDSCEPRDEDNMRDCKKNKKRYMPIREPVMVMKTGNERVAETCIALNDIQKRINVSKQKELTPEEKEEREKVIDFILFLMEKYDLDGINPLELR